MGRIRIYQKLGKKDDACKLYREWIGASRSSDELNNFAMQVSAYNQPEDRDADLAIEAATRACELTSHAKSWLLATLATAYAAKGEFETAVKWQLKAIELLDEGKDRKAYEDNLNLFRENKSVPPDPSRSSR